MDEQLGKEHATACFHDPVDFNLPGPRTTAYAHAALDQLDRLQRQQGGMHKALLAGGSHGAKQLNVDPVQGLREIVQNADDLKASEVRFGTRTVNGRAQLLIAHNGLPVELRHVLPMIYPFLSTKRGDASQKGRFGVGLKTLSRLGGGLSIHSEPYHFASLDNLAVRTEPAAVIPGFYDPASGDTLFMLFLGPDHDPEFFKGWFAMWQPSDLLFLDTVRRLVLHDLDMDDAPQIVEVVEMSSAQPFELVLADEVVRAEQQRFAIGGSLWERFVTWVPVPANRHREEKATSSKTPISVAVPVGHLATGWLHVALPTRICTGAAFSVDAQFDPATSREELVQSPWNKWLVGVSCEVIAALAIALAQRTWSLAWLLMPVGAATTSTASWLNDRFAKGFAKAIEAIVAHPTLIGGDENGALSAWSYCDLEAEGLLEPEDHVSVCSLPMLPAEMRDDHGSWRNVVETLGISRRLGLTDLLDQCDTEVFEGKPIGWFLDLAGRCLEHDEDHLLFDQKWVPLANGTRSNARVAGEAVELLALDAGDEQLARRHSLVSELHPEVSSVQHATVRRWLLAEANAVERPKPVDILRAFATKFANEPLETSKEEMLELRLLFAGISDRDLGNLGIAVGAALKIEAQQYEVGDRGLRRSIRMWASPSQCYLPSSIDDEREGWAVAAGDTPGLIWASPGYQDVFKVSRGDTLQAKARPRGAKRFLQLLGAVNAPRIVEGATRVGYDLPYLQLRARAFGRAQMVLDGDGTSPDLECVVADIIGSSQGTKRRRAGRRRTTNINRSVALFRCIAAAWPSLEAQSTTRLRRESGRGGDLHLLPATWLAKLAEVPWMLTDGGVFARPRDLAISTKVTSAIYDDPSKFAAGLGPADAATDLARMLGMKIDPTASELVVRLEEYRREATPAEQGDILRLYHALAGHCQATSVRSIDDRVSDMTVGALRGKFGISRNRPGLIAACVTTSGGEEWYAPNSVFSGRDIFHKRQPFVLNDKELAPLWAVLNISPPSIADCVRELKALANTPDVPDRDAILIDVYRHIDQLLDRPSAADRRLLAELPLLTQTGWVTARPIYRTDYARISLPNVQLWEPPCALGTIKRFASAIDVTELEIEDRPISASFGAPTELETRFEIALKLLRSSLAKEDERTYRAVPWTRLERLPLNIHPVGGLVVRALLKNAKPVPVTARAHAQIATPGVHVDDPELIGRTEYGGFAIARFVEVARQRDVALAWLAAWASSADAEIAATIELASEEAQDNIDQLAAEFDRLKKSNGKRKMRSQPAGKGGASPELKKIEYRSLKQASGEFSFTLSMRSASPEQPKGHQESQKAPMVNSSPGASDKNAGTGQKPPPASAQRHYDNRDLQKMGWDHVQMAFDEGALKLDDFQQTRGIGADGALEWKRFVEMKAVGREMPSQISLTEMEFRRAQEQKGCYLLVLVTGLEEGFQTQITVFADPLNTLPWVPRGSVSIGGLSSGPAVILKAVEEVS